MPNKPLYIFDANAIISALLLPDSIPRRAFDKARAQGRITARSTVAVLDAAPRHIKGDLMSRPQALFKVLRGLIVAVTTPFNKDLSLDLGGMRALVDFYCEHRVGPLIIGGSTGEFHALTIAERQRIVETAVEQSRGRLPVIAGCAHSGTQIALDLMVENTPDE